MKITIEREGKVPVTAGGVGLFFEDLNYALDGGLYAEMLENRNFEAKNAHGEWDKYVVEDDGGYAWEVYPEGAEVALKVKTDRALFPENPHYMRLAAAENAGMKNKAYDGVYLQAGKEYKCSFYARSYDYKGAVKVGVYDKGVPYLEKKFKLKADGQWHRYAFRAKSKTEAERADFCITLCKAGTVHLDAFSLMPANAVMGVFRRDLVELMAEMKPGFLRFPGGCVVEGNNLANRYLWKNTIGPVERRKHNWNRWAVHATGPHNNFRSEYSHYGQSLGLGYYEYFRLAEYLGAKPLPVVSVGIACQYMSTEFVPLDSPELETYIQEALDVVEFANGDVNTVWGRVRAELGHPEPFKLEYLGVGNEQWETETTKERAGNEFYKRFELFEKRIHERYPDLKIVGTVGPTVDSDSHKSAWKWTRKNLAKNPNFVYCSDEHFYVSPEWLYEHVNVYDGYPRGGGLVYAGEYAAHVPGSGCALFNAPQANVWEGSLAEAAFMTGMERNADIVVMKSYAPLFARLGYTQWSPDLIWFNGKTAYGSPSYHVQKLFSLYTGDDSLKTTVDGKGVYASATERDAFVYVKAVNSGAEEVDVEVEGDFDFGSLTRIIRLSGALGDYNTAEEPDRISPVDVAPTEPRSLTLAPHSFQVLVFKK